MAFSTSFNAANKIYYTLLFASAMCFIGHGAFGIIGKAIWLNYFAVFGIGHDLAYALMPVLGAVDIIFGISLLIYPTRAVLGWLVIWGLVTAALRPLSGEPFAELIERAGNYGAPLTLLIFTGISGLSFAGWFKFVDPEESRNDEKTLANITLVLRVVIFLLLAGHGWLNLIEKKGLIGQYTSLGFTTPAQVAHMAGIFEIAAALLILIKPLRPILIALLIWKISSELFYPKWEAFEWIERGGSYGAILALYFVLPKTSARAKTIQLQQT